MMSRPRLIAAACALAIGASAQPSVGQEDPNSVVQGFVRFMAYHEAGHLLMNQVHDINPSTWPKDEIERYADEIAMVLLVPDAGDPNGVAEIVGAANGWLNAGAGHAANDPHAPPRERAFNIICFLYGSDPEGFAQFKQYVQDDWNCEQKFKEVDDDIEYGFVNYDGTGIPIELTYQPPSPEMAEAKEYLEASGILEDLVFDIEADFKLTRQTKLMAMDCKPLGGDVGTFHFQSFRTAEHDYDRITICYELVDMWIKHKLTGAEAQGGEPGEATEDPPLDDDTTGGNGRPDRDPVKPE